MFDFRLNNNIPFNIVNKISILSKFVVLLQKFLAVYECSIVVSNNLAQGGEVPLFRPRQSTRANKSKRLLSPSRFCIFDDTFYISQILSEIPYIISKFMILSG